MTTLGNSAERVPKVVLHPDDPLPNPARILPMADLCEIVLLASYMALRWDVAKAVAPDGLGALVSAILHGGSPVVMTGLGSRDPGGRILQEGSYLIAWKGRRLSQVAAARAVLGERPFNRYTPITMSSAGAVPVGGTPR